MTAVADSGAGLVDPTIRTSGSSSRRDPLSRLHRSVRFPLYLLVAMAILSLAREITGAGQLTAEGTFRSALQLSMPIALAGLGGLWAERAGVVNIGLEGMMVLGTWFGAYGAIAHGPWTGVLYGVLGGAVGGLLHAIATVSFGVDHIISGVAINLLGVGLTNFLTTTTSSWGPQTKESPEIPNNIVQVDLIPFIKSPLETVSGQNRFLLSDVSKLILALTTNVSLLVVIGVLLFPATWYVLWRTPIGLRLRSVGEDPEAADSLGVKVYAMKYLAVMMSGAFAGLGGVMLVYLFAEKFQSGQTGGRGFIGLAAMIFGNWRPGGLILGAGLFGFMDSMQSQVNDTAHALLVVAAMALLLLGLQFLVRKAALAQAALLALLAAALFVVLEEIRTGDFVSFLPLPHLEGFAFVVVLVAAATGWIAAVWSMLRSGWVGGALMVPLAYGLWLWYEGTTELPSEMIPYFPHITTLLVLVFASQRLRMPAADGRIYRRSGR